MKIDRDLDAETFTKADLAQLYRARWNAELDLKSLKQTMRMEILRCKTPNWSAKKSGRTCSATTSVRHHGSGSQQAWPQSTLP